MKKVLVVMLLVLSIVSVAVMSGISAENTRTAAVYVKELLALTGADSAGDIIKPERNEVRYPFVPLKKAGKVIGYGTWVAALPVYQHVEDLIIVVNPDATLQNFKAIDANSHHQNMHDETWKSKFYGMTKDRDFITKSDLNAGSTMSTNIMFAEMKNSLFVFDKYVKPNLK